MHPNTNWTLDPEASAVVLKPARRVRRYINSTLQSGTGSIVLNAKELTDAQLEFDLDLSATSAKGTIASHTSPRISFKSLSFQKINSNINFIKGILTLNHVSRIVELELVLTDLTQENGGEKASFEIYGILNKREFGWNNNGPILIDGYPLGQNLTLTAHIEFKHYAVA